MVKEILKIFDKLFGKILEDFGDRLYAVYLSKRNSKPIYNRLLDLSYIRYGDGRCHYGKCYNLKNRTELLKIKEYREFYKSLNYFNKKALIKKIIEEFQIKCYDDCDKFIISIIVLFKSITKKNIDNIFNKEQSNSQATALISFLEEIQTIKPKLLNKNIKSYLIARENIINNL